MKDYIPKIVKIEQDPLTDEDKRNELIMKGRQMDDLIFNDDYEFPVDDVPIALSALTNVKGQQAKINVFYPQVILIDRTDKENLQTLKHLFIGKSYTKGDQNNFLDSDLDDDATIETINNALTLKEMFAYFINHFHIEHKDFGLKPDKPNINNWEKVWNQEFGDEGIPSKTYEDIWVFQIEDREYMLIFQKPIIEYRDIGNSYAINFHPWVASKTKSKDKSVTYSDVFKWLFQNSENWLVNVVDFITTFEAYDTIVK